MTRSEIRRRALHAAAAVSFTVGTVGLAACGSSVVLETAAADEGAGGAASAPAPTATTPADPAPDAAAPDATADAGPACQEPGVDYSACCQANNWSPEAGCLAWGPPMPPALGVS
jgi:hypothetical protein